jgi:hypothetical protein
LSEPPRDAAGRFVPARSAIQRREFALIAQKNPDLSKMAPAEREAVAAFLGIKADDLQAAHAFAWRNPPADHRLTRAQPAALAADELAKMSPIDRRALQLRLRQR